MACTTLHAFSDDLLKKSAKQFALGHCPGTKKTGLKTKATNSASLKLCKLWIVYPHPVHNSDFQKIRRLYAVLFTNQLHVTTNPSVYSVAALYCCPLSSAQLNRNLEPVLVLFLQGSFRSYNVFLCSLALQPRSRRLSGSSSASWQCLAGQLWHFSQHHDFLKKNIIFVHRAPFFCVFSIPLTRCLFFTFIPAFLVLQEPFRCVLNILLTLCLFFNAILAIFWLFTISCFNFLRAFSCFICLFICVFPFSNIIALYHRYN